MRYFLSLFVLLLIAKDITSDQCPPIFDINPHCICQENIATSLFELNCTYTNDKNLQYFQIKFIRNEVELTSFQPSNWSNVLYNFQHYLLERKVFYLNHCIFDENTNLSQIAESLNAINIEEIHLTNTFRIDTIGYNKQLFRGFRKIKKLYITNNINLTTLDNDLLDFLPHLTNIHLVNNSLQNIAENCFEFLPNLNILQLSENDIRHLMPNLFRNLSALKHLDLSHNKLDDLHPDIFVGMNDLEILLLNNNKFTWLPVYAFTKLRNLKYLDLSSNGLVSLLENVFRNNMKLRSLNLQNNQLKTLPYRIFEKLRNLRTLNIENNQIQWLPENIFSTLVNLTTLNLNGNQLRYFQDLTFENLMKLEVLSLRRNQLENLADSRFERREMNDFITTSKLFERTWEDEEYDRKKRADYPLVSIFFNCTNLINLDLAYNNIQKIHDDWFLLSKLNLEILNLTHNSISELNFNQVLHQKRHFHIDLSHNKIVGIVPNNFSNIRIASKFRITVIISENPINCDCKIAGLLQYIHYEIINDAVQFMTLVTKNVKCQRPEKLKGRSLSSLKTDELSCELLMPQNYNSFCHKKCNVHIEFAKEKLQNCNNENSDLINQEHMTNCTTNIKEKEIYKFNCANRHLMTIPNDMCIVPGMNVELDMTNNNFYRIPILNHESDYEAVTKLILSENRITSIRGISSYKNLQTLEINNNKMISWKITKSELREMSSMKHLENIHLHKSLFMCNNDLMSLFDYEVSAIISNVRQLSCIKPDTLELIYPFLLQND